MKKQSRRWVVLLVACALVPACGGGHHRGGSDGVVGPKPTPPQKFVLSTLTVGSGPFQTAVGDINRDGELDLVVTNGSDNSVSVFLGNGNGTFRAPTTITTGIGTTPTAVSLVDVTNDGILDLLVVNFGSNTVSVLKGDGSGGFTAVAGSPVAVGTSPEYLVVSDFNKDGIVDLAVSNVGSNNVTILLGSGGGAFAPAAGSPIATGGEPFGMVAADLNGDGSVDLAVVNALDSTLTILLGNGSGGFTATAASPIAVGAGPRLLVTADFNGDGIPDLAVSNFTDSSVSVLLGSAGAVFTLTDTIPLAAGSQTRGIATADFNGDGFADLVAVNPAKNTVSFAAGNGHGGFAAPVDFSTGAASGPLFVTVADFDRDGRPDLAIVTTITNRVTVMMNSTLSDPAPGTFDRADSFAAGLFPFAAASGDFNGDGIPDVLVSNIGAGTVSVFLGDGSGALVAAPAVTVGTTPVGLVVGDFNKDGALDFAVCNESDNTVSILLGNGDGTFTPAAGSPISVPGSPAGLAVGDFNGDHKLDLAISAFGTGHVILLLGAGDGTFAAAPGSPFAVGTGPWGIVAADINGDGILDLATANHGAGTVSVLLGDGAGGFSSAPGSPFATGVSLPYNIVSADFNRDGKGDVVISSQGGSKAAVLFGSATGALGAPHQIQVGTACFGCAAADLNGDGNPDLVISDSSAQNVQVLFGDGHGGFTPALGGPVALGGGGFQLAIVDLNLDGKPDLVIPGEIPGVVGVFLNH